MGFVYRLQLLLERKEEAQKEAEQQVTQREQELQTQITMLENLKKREKELVARRLQMRRDLLSKASPGASLTAGDVQQRADYVKAMVFEIEQAGNEILAQNEVIATCQARVDEAKQLAQEARREVEVLTKHRSRQEERYRREEQAKEDLALDEVGNVLYSTRRSST